MIAHDGFWLSPPSYLWLSAQDVHVWRASLKVEAPRLQSLKHTLSEDELMRAERFHFQKDREHFIAARGLLRTILARYLKAEPGHLQFCYNPYGKPALAQTSEDKCLSFNLSHSGGLALFAIACGRPLGVDLEQTAADFDYQRIAEQFFSPREYALLDAMPEPMKHQYFFWCWTRKEAYLKGKGEGLSSPLDKVDVSSKPDEPAMLSNPGGGTGLGWLVRTLFAGDNYAAALAVKGNGWRLTCWQWRD